MVFNQLSPKSDLKCSKVFLEDLIAKSNITVLFNCILFLPESTEGVAAGQTTAIAQDIVDYEKIGTISSTARENDVKTVQND